MRRLLLLFCALLAMPSGVFALERQPSADYHARRVALAARLKGGIAVLFAAQQPLVDFLPYRQDSDFYYLTGWNEPGAALLVQAAAPAKDDAPARPYREVLLLPTRNLRMEKYTGVKLDAAAPDAAKKAGVDEVLSMDDLPRLLNKLVTANRTLTRNFWSQQDIPQSTALMTWTASTLGMDTPPSFSDVRSLTMALRNVKDAGEIALLKKAADASIAAQLEGMKAIKPGVSERTIGGLILYNLLKDGCERPSYSPIVGSGIYSTVLHYSDNGKTMEDGDVVVIDAAGEYSMYASDITRTMPVNGHFTARQKEIYNIVLGAQQAAMKAFVAGQFLMGDPRRRTTDVKDTLDNVAYQYINTHGKDLHGQPLGQYFIHGLGHSVGIDVHDPMDYETVKLDKGMVFTIEPGIYIPEEKLGVRIEDVVYVDGNGKLVDLIANLPHTPEEVEAAMRP